MPQGCAVRCSDTRTFALYTSAAAFTFNAKGVWTVTLTFADNTTRTAQIDIQTAGFMLIVR